VVRHLEGIDPAAAKRARERYRCFEPYRKQPEEYGIAALLKGKDSCRDVARQQVDELQRLYQSQTARTPKAGSTTARGMTQEERLFSALQNARVVQNAEEYYRVSVAGTGSSWNLRDQHMTDTLEALAAFLSAQQGRPAKLVVWAHNSHVGDARVTQTGSPQEWNIGQLMRERHPANTVLVGFTTYQGTVTAARAWDKPGETRTLLPALPGSFAAVFHGAGMGNFVLPLRGNREIAAALPEPRLERAVGVVYLPQTERQSHYFLAHITKQFDTVIHINETRALKPLKP
jgi:erythromycin esterase-like protein